MAGIRKPKADEPLVEDEVQAAIATLEAHGIVVRLRPPDVSERDDVIAWLDAHGYGREAETLRRDADRA